MIEKKVQKAISKIQAAYDGLESLMTNQNLDLMNKWPVPPNWGLVHHIMDGLQQDILELHDEFEDIC